MCNYATITKCIYGSVSRCQYCGSIEVLFGTSLVHFEYDNMNRFLNYIKNVSEDHRVKHSAEKNIVLDLALTYVLQVVLNINELEAFNTMLEDADTLITQQDLLRLFNND